MSYEENEIVMLLLGVGVLIFIVVRREQLKQLPKANLFIACFCVLLVGWLATVLEGCFAPSHVYYKLCNYLEHLCYACSAVLFTGWCWKAFVMDRET